MARSFRMNDWGRVYSYEEMVEVYRRSKIGLNISRDDRPNDANLRVFEVMAAGALLVTSLPSELENLGFRSGQHFTGHRKESDLLDCIRYYLEHDSDREQIAAAGRELVLKEHTYDRRAEEIMKILDRDGGQLFAPARSWPEDRVRQVYLDYYSANNLLGCAFEEFCRLAALRPTTMWRSLPPILGAVRRELITTAKNSAKGIVA
ncbi:MAG TPA: glycosyltransferase [Candidatus Acidoferrales bacterium]|nr:glycosyltransferase [Candidatus Acidoferrales bacterium]